MPQVFRISLVKMVHAKYPRKDTPEPFMELRSFIFLDRLPAGIYLGNLRKSLDSSIREMMEKVLPHIFKGKEGNYEYMEQEPKGQINLKQKTRYFKVEIDGFEVEQIDLDEIFSERLYWNVKGYRMPFDHTFFNKSRIGRVLSDREKLGLTTRRIYRYMAFYDEDGDIKGEYDEGDLREIMKKISSIESQSLQIRKMFNEATSLLQKVTDEIEKSVSELEGYSRSFRV
jgi:hypothetical protein